MYYISFTIFPFSLELITESIPDSLPSPLSSLATRSLFPISFYFKIHKEVTAKVQGGLGPFGSFSQWSHLELQHSASQHCNPVCGQFTHFVPSIWRVTQAAPQPEWELCQHYKSTPFHRPIYSHTYPPAPHHLQPLSAPNLSLSLNICYFKNVI